LIYGSREAAWFRWRNRSGEIGRRVDIEIAS